MCRRSGTGAAAGRSRLAVIERRAFDGFNVPCAAQQEIGVIVGTPRRALHRWRGIERSGSGSSPAVEYERQLQPDLAHGPRRLSRIAIVQTDGVAQLYASAAYVMLDQAQNHRGRNDGRTIVAIAQCSQVIEPKGSTPLPALTQSGCSSGSSTEARSAFSSTSPTDRRPGAAEENDAASAPVAADVAERLFGPAGARVGHGDRVRPEADGCSRISQAGDAEAAEEPRRRITVGVVTE